MCLKMKRFKYAKYKKIANTSYFIRRKISIISIIREVFDIKGHKINR